MIVGKLRTYLCIALLAAAAAEYGRVRVANVKQAETIADLRRSIETQNSKVDKLGSDAKVEASAAESRAFSSLLESGKRWAALNTGEHGPESMNRWLREAIPQ